MYFRNCTNMVPAYLSTTDLALEEAGTNVSLTWTYVYDQATDNHLFRSNDGGLNWVDIDSGDHSWVSSADTCPDGDTHLYRLRIEDPAVGRKKWSNIAIAGARATDPVTAPSGLAGEVSGSDINLTWSANASGENVKAYRIMRAATEDGHYSYIGSSLVESYTDPAPASGTYWYRVTAISGEGDESEPSTAASVVI